MVSILRLDDAETRKWAWSLIDEGRRKIAIELLDADRAIVEQGAVLTVFVAELESLYQTSFASRSLRSVETSGLVVVAVGQTKSGRRVSQVDWRHTVSPVAVLRNPIRLDELLADTKYVNLRQELVSGERVVRLRSWDSGGFLSALLAACDDTDRVGTKSVVQATVREPESSHVSNILAQERDATISAMKISGVVDSLADLQYVPVDSGDPTPFLGRVESQGSGGREPGVPLIRQHEDSIIGLDARNLLDWIGRETDHAAAMVFSNRDGRQLTVINANRLGIEQAVGADLVYYSPNYRAYVLVQYKMMSAGQGNRIDPSNWKFRPDKKFRDQLVRMRKVESSQLQGEDSGPDHDSYRLGRSLTYFKFCRHDTGLDAKTQLMKGSYISTEFVDVLLAST